MTGGEKNGGGRSGIGPGVGSRSTQRAEARHRALRAGELPELLELLDGWPVADGWRGRDFFARYLSVPSFSPEDVRVAVVAGRLVSCVQIFPMSILARGREPESRVAIPVGGIGSVYTAPDARRRGFAEALLADACQEMRRRGHLVSLLAASRVRWYARLGWRPWSDRRLELEGEFGRDADPVADCRDVDLAWDLEDLVRLHAETARRRVGVRLRSADDWRTSFQVAGNPEEETVVALGPAPVPTAEAETAPVLAYARGALLYGEAQLLEWGYGEGAEAAAAAAIEEAARRLQHDPRLEPARTATSGRARAVAPPTEDPELLVALRARGFEVEETSHPDSTWMARCLDPDALRSAIGVGPEVGDPLEAALPRSELGFWRADRF